MYVCIYCDQGDSKSLLSQIQSLLSCLSCPPEYVLALITGMGHCGHDLALTQQVVHLLLTQYCHTFNSTPHLTHILHVVTRASIKNRLAAALHVFFQHETHLLINPWNGEMLKGCFYV